MTRQYTRTSPAPPAPATWIVAADAGEARVFQSLHDDGELSEVSHVVNIEARQRAQEVQSDRAGSSGGNSFAPRTDHATHAAAEFARRLGRYLGEARQSGRVDRIYLLAAPAFLGQLRAELDEPTRRIVVNALPKDLVHHTPTQIRQALPARL